MDELKESLLKKKFPKLFKYLHTKKTTRENPLIICIQFGIECGDGWFDLIYRLSEKLENEINKLPTKDQEHVYAMQVKEKYGTLRFYLSSETDDMFQLIEDAERESEITCEECGKAGILSTNGWWKVRCTECS